MGLFDIFRPNIEKLKERRDIDGLIKACETPEEEIRKDAVSALMELMPTALPHLITAAVDRDEKRRSCAALALHQIGAPAVSPVVTLLLNEEGRKSEYAAAALASIGKPSVVPLIKCLSDIGEEKSDLIVATLVHIGKDAAPLLREGLFCPSYRSRRASAQALDIMREAPLTEREAAARLIALGRWKELPRFKHEAVPILIDLLSDEYYVPRVNAARALGQLGDDAAIPHLHAIFSDPDGNVRTAAAEALGTIGDARAIPILVSALEDEYYSVRMEAAGSLDRLDWHPTNDNERARYFIATEQWEKVIEIGKAAIPPLIDTLRDNYYSVQKGITEALRRLSRHSIGPLEEALGHPDIRIRNGAGEVLISLGKSDQLFRPIRQKKEEETLPEKKEKGGGRSTIDLSKKEVSSDDKVKLSRQNKVAQKPQEEKREESAEEEETERVSLFQEKEFVAVRRVIQAIDPHVHEKLAGIGNITKKAFDEEYAEPLIYALLRALNGGDDDSRLIALDALVSLGSSAFPILIAALSDPSPAIRAAATETIGRIGDPSVGRYIIPLLDDGEGIVRTEAAKALGNLQCVDAVPQLIRSLIDMKTDVRREAMTALSRIGSPAFHELVAALDAPSNEIRAGVARALGSIGDQRAIPHLILHLGEGAIDVRTVVIEALIGFDVAAIRPLEEVMSTGNPEEKIAALIIFDGIGINATYLIERALKDPNPAVSRKAAYLLKVDDQIGSDRQEETSEIPDSADEITPLIQDLLIGNKEAQIRSAQQLVHKGSAAVPPLIEILMKGNREQRATAGEILSEIRGPAVQELQRLLSEGGRDTRVAVALLLGKIGDQSSVEPLISMLSDRDYQLRKAAAESLGFNGSSQAVPALINALSDDDPDVQVSAIRALGYIGDAQAITPLIQKLADEDFSIRSAAVESLAGMDKEGVLPLVAALSDSEKEVRSGAAEALREIGWTPDDDEVNARFLLAQGLWNEVANVGEKAIPVLISASTDPDEDVRMGVIRALGKTGNPGVIPHLIRGLSDEYTMIRKISADAFFDIGDAALPALEEEMNEADPMGRKMIQGICDRIRRRSNNS
ncbi:MAG: HEAT repeat domain-containing protein [Methanocalculus sp.]|uniref:HEAT repeat domain-containing protein n=1 Tax=Methanocalculus sp. TaxID=2004547 RepID=UPI00272177A5|nr:HEAT repeat domain-containing protein [Methanocalculus sp.]MDO9539196.1 HEAT repeat domain-containing protein [Methanocalculus sp.]